MTISMLITGCQFKTNQEQSYTDLQKSNATSKDIMDYEKIIQGNNHGIVSVEELKSQTLENQYGFVLKIKATNKYTNVLEYEMLPDVNNLLTGYDNVEKDKNGYFISKAISPSSSYLLTNVIVEEIYHLGNALNINEGDNVQIAELCYIAAQASPYVIHQNESEQVLFCQEDMIKLEPNEEYIIFGYKNNDKESSKYGHLRTVGFQEGIYHVDNEKEKSFYQKSNKDLVINECINKLESLQRENGIIMTN
ncbi:MAG: hypothetical protein J6B80_01980 [Clostridia bacterium]|nr:hypothetical protein [Clostridia bacterium]